VVLGDSAHQQGPAPWSPPEHSAALTNAAVGGLTISVLLEQLRDPAVEAALAQATAVTITSGANDFGCAVGAAFDPTCTATSDALARTVHATSAAARPPTTRTRP